MKDLFDMTDEEKKIYFFKLRPKVLLCSIPDNISDNDPLLIEKMQSIYNTNFKAFKFHFPGTEISCMESEYIKKQIYKLTEFPLLHSPTIQIKVTRYLQFLEDQEKRISKPAKTQKILTFDDLFRDKNNAKRVKDIFETHGYTVNNKWQGLSDNKSELLCAYYVLKPLLKTVLKPTPQARIFYNHFGLYTNEQVKKENLPYPGYITERMFTDEPFNNDSLEFEQIFSDLLQPKK